MADEVLGKTYEVMTLVAIEDFTSILTSGEVVFWNEHPPGVSIEPDLCIGNTLAKPRLILQIHHTAAERASEKKFWRNVGEFVEARLVLGNKMAIGNIVFGGGGKLRLAKASDNLFDAFYEGITQVYIPELLALANRVTESIKKSKPMIPVESRPDHFRMTLRSDKAGLKAFRLFASELESLLKGINPVRRSGWYGAYTKSIGSRLVIRIPPAARQTHLRRGLGRLLPIDTITDFDSICLAVKSKSTVSAPSYFGLLGLSSKSLRGEKITDGEIGSAIDLLNSNTLRDLWQHHRSSTTSMKQACAGILAASDCAQFHSFFLKKYSDLVTPKGMLDALNDAFDDPCYVLGEKILLRDPANSGVWPFEYAMTAIKAHSGKQQGYGYTRLADDAGFRFEIAATAGVVVSPFIQRRKKPDKKILRGIATALASRISGLGLSWFKSSANEVSSFYLRGLFEDKIYKTASYDPCKRLVEMTFPKAQKIARHPTFLTTADTAGTATTSLMKVDKALIVTQSASDAGVAHKVKELAGRSGMLRASLGGKYGYALVIDGTWTDKHFGVLHDAGFDAIFYPDEMDELKRWVASL